MPPGTVHSPRGRQCPSRAERSAGPSGTAGPSRAARRRPAGAARPCGDESRCRRCRVGLGRPGRGAGREAGRGWRWARMRPRCRGHDDGPQRGLLRPRARAGDPRRRTELSRPRFDVRLSKADRERPRGPGPPGARRWPGHRRPRTVRGGQRGDGPPTSPGWPARGAAWGWRRRGGAPGVGGWRGRSRPSPRHRRGPPAPTPDRSRRRRAASRAVHPPTRLRPGRPRPPEADSRTLLLCSPWRLTPDDRKRSGNHRRLTRPHGGLTKSGLTLWVSCRVAGLNPVRCARPARTPRSVEPIVPAAHHGSSST